MKTVLVIARDFREFRQEVMERSLSATDLEFITNTGTAAFYGKKYIFLPSPEHMRGYNRDVELEFWGRWYLLPDRVVEEFKAMARSRGLM